MYMLQNNVLNWPLYRPHNFRYLSLLACPLNTSSLWLPEQKLKNNPKPAHAPFHLLHWKGAKNIPEVEQLERSMMILEDFGCGTAKVNRTLTLLQGFSGKNKHMVH